MIIYNVYSTDNWHSYASREFLGCFDNLDTAVAHISEYMIENGADEHDFTEGWAIQFLYDNFQTGSSDIDMECEIDAVELNEWVA